MPVSTAIECFAQQTRAGARIEQVGVPVGDMSANGVCDGIRRGIAADADIAVVACGPAIIALG